MRRGKCFLVLAQVLPTLYPWGKRWQSHLSRTVLRVEISSTMSHLSRTVLRVQINTSRFPNMLHSCKYRPVLNNKGLVLCEIHAQDDIAGNTSIQDGAELCQAEQKLMISLF